MQAASLFDGLSFDDFHPFECGRSPAEVHAMSMSDWSDEETNDPLVADVRNFYKVEKWTKDGAKVDRLLYGGNNLDKARDVFAKAIKHRRRIRLTIRQRTRVLDQWPQTGDPIATISWSIDRHGVRTTFDHDSKRLKQFELSGRCRERFSLSTYPDELTAREAEFRQETKYGKWSGHGADRSSCSPTR
jgi:hypothetical protein